MKTCLFCEDPLKGRSDKKFCDDTCRNAFNNRKSSDSNNLMRRVNRILSKNRRILKDLHLLQTEKLNREILMYKGFVFNYFTSVYENQNGKRCYFIYDLGYCFLDEKDFEIALISKNEKN